LIFGSARESFSRLSVLPESEVFTFCALPPSLEVTGMCRCSLGNILDVGAEGTVQGGDVGAFGTVVQEDVRAVGTVVQKDVVAFGTVDKKDVVAAGTVRKSVSAVSHQSSFISPGLKVSDPMLGVGDGRCAGDIPPSPGCAASRPHEHTPGGAVLSNTVSSPEVKNRAPRYNISCYQRHWETFVQQASIRNSLVQYSLPRPAHKQPKYSCSLGKFMEWKRGHGRGIEGFDKKYRFPHPLTSWFKPIEKTSG